MSNVQRPMTYEELREALIKSRARIVDLEQCLTKIRNVAFTSHGQTGIALQAILDLSESTSETA